MNFVLKDILTVTFVEKVGLSDIALAQTKPLTNLRTFLSVTFHRKYGVQIGTSRERILRVVHDRIIVVGQSERIHFLLGQFVEVVLLT